MLKQLFVLFLLSLVSLSIPDSAAAQSGAAMDKIPVVVVSTSYGDIRIVTYQNTPLHAANFLKLAREGFYDGTTFHRVIKEFMVQGGDVNSKDTDPNNDGQGSIGYTIPAEILPQYYHKRGAVAGARLGDNVNPQKESSGSQFYIVHGRKFAAQELQYMGMQRYTQEEYLQKPEQAWIQEINWQELQKTNPDTIAVLNQKIQADVAKAYEKVKDKYELPPAALKEYAELGGAPHLDGGYTVFGEVIDGMDVVDNIVNAEKGPADRPVKDIKLTVKVEEMSAKQLLEKYNYNAK